MSSSLDDSSGSFLSERRHLDLAGVDPEERLDKVREWALSLSLPRLARGELGSSILSLPPLPLRSIVPSVEGSFSQMSTGNNDSLDTSKTLPSTVVSEGPVMKIDEDHPWPPKVSQLGSIAISEVVPKVSFGFFEAEAARKLELRRATRDAQRPWLLPRRSPRPPNSPVILRKRSTLQKRLVNSKDPMATSIFSRDAVLEADLQRKGLYEAQLQRRPH